MSWWIWAPHVAWLAALATWAVVAARPRQGRRSLRRLRDRELTRT
jgi:hypothetical protein